MYELTTIINNKDTKNNSLTSGEYWTEYADDLKLIKSIKYYINYVNKHTHYDYIKFIIENVDNKKAITLTYNK